MGYQVPWELVPVRYMAGGLRRYYESGIPPGSFLTALLSNDLAGSFAAADLDNTENMLAWVRFLWNDFDEQAWGSPRIVSAWIETGGLGVLPVYRGS